MNSSTLDQEEVQRFSDIASEWWDYNGKFRPLHVLSSTRLQYIREQICSHFDRDVSSSGSLEGLRILDIGCGGGLVSEPVAKMGADMTSIDPGRANIEAAKLHAENEGVNINYRCMTVEDLAGKGQVFDVVLLLEVVEHVPDVNDFVKICSSLVGEGGLLIMSTINRTLKSYALAIVGAEYVLRWLPVGTHQWDRFVKPEELELAAQGGGLQAIDKRGMVYNPLSDKWSLSHNLDVNYFLTSCNTRSRY